MLFIAIDDLRPLLGAYGHQEVHSPRIDKLGDSGTVSLNASCQFPVCGASRASIMTGLRPESTGVLNLKTKMRDVHPDILTIPQYFKTNGYTTAAVGKIFDPRCVDGREHGDKESWSKPYNEGPDGTVPLVDKGKQAWGAFDGPDDGFTDGRIGRTGQETLKELAAEDEPFFVAVGFKKPHLPFNAPKRFGICTMSQRSSWLPFRRIRMGTPDTVTGTRMKLGVMGAFPKKEKSLRRYKGN